MRESIYRITLDMHHDASQVQIKAKQNDVARRIYAKVTEDGKPYTIEPRSSAVMMIKKPDGTVIYNDCDINLIDSVVIYDFTAQTVAVTGLLECEIRLYGTNNELLTSPRFNILVASSVYQDGQVESDDEFGTLTSAITAVNTMDVDVSKSGHTVTIEVTKPDGTELSETVTSPTATVTKSGKVATVSVTDEDGTTSASVTSPTASVTKTGSIAYVTVTDEDGTSTAEILDGTAAGFGTPTATATTLESYEQATVSVTASGTDAQKVFNFSFGIPKGPAGPSGPGSGDMNKSDYDPNSVVKGAGGIINYVGTQTNGKANKVSSPTAGNFAGLNANGDLTDSGKDASDFDPAGTGASEAASAVSTHNSNASAHSTLFNAKEAKGYLTIGGTTYQLELTNTDPGQATAGKFIFVYE